MCPVISTTISYGGNLGIRTLSNSVTVEILTKIAEAVWWGRTDTTSLGYNLSGIQPLWDTTSLGYNLFGIQPLWDTTSLGYNLSGIQPLWDTTSLGYNLSGIQPLWDTTSLGYNLSGNAIILDSTVYTVPKGFLRF